MAELKDYTVHELTRELYNRKHVAFVLFDDTDVSEGFKGTEGHTPTEGELESWWREHRSSLQDIMTMRGWDYIYDSI